MVEKWLENGSVCFATRGACESSRWQIFAVSDSQSFAIPIAFCPLMTPAMRHCEERSDEAIQTVSAEAAWIASLRSQ